MPASVKMEAPRETSAKVREPAACFPRTARSVPMRAPRNAARSSFPNMMSVGSGTIKSILYKVVSIRYWRHTSGRADGMCELRGEGPHGRHAQIARFFQDFRDAFGLHAVFLEEVFCLHVPAEDDVIIHEAALLALGQSRERGQGEHTRLFYHREESVVMRVIPAEEREPRALRVADGVPCEAGIRDEPAFADARRGFRRMREVFESRLYIERILHVRLPAGFIVEFRLDANVPLAFLREHVNFMRRAAARHGDAGSRLPAVGAQYLRNELLEREPGRTECEDSALHRIARGDGRRPLFAQKLEGMRIDIFRAHAADELALDVRDDVGAHRRSGAGMHERSIELAWIERFLLAVGFGNENMRHIVGVSIQ